MSTQYDCVVCTSTSIVSEHYMQFLYVQEKCCSLFCFERKSDKPTMENSQESGVENVKISF